jgi:hypothetical protein
MWTTADKHTCVQRELTLRIRVYARLVAQGKMSRESAAREISLMTAICEDYRKQDELEGQHEDWQARA